MSDLIDREALLADQTNITEFEYDECCKDEFVSVDAIRGAPTVNAIPTPVRCKDCSWWDRHTEVDKACGNCHRIGFTMSENGYCSMGERESEESE